MKGKNSCWVKQIAALLMGFLFFSCFCLSVVFANSEQQLSYETYKKTIGDFIRKKNKPLSEEWVNWLTESIIYYSVKHEVHPLLITALIAQESNFNIDAYSSAGAIGLTQLMPATGKSLQVNPYLPDQNLEGGVRYLSQQLRNHAHDYYQIAYALAAYNAGPGAVQKYNGIPPYKETIHYVQNVIEDYNELARRYYTNYDWLKNH